MSPFEDVERVERYATVFAVETDFARPSKRSKESPNELYLGATKTYSPGFVGRNVKRGIPSDKDKFVPQFANKMGVSPNSTNWEQSTKEFWEEYTYKMPFGTITGGDIQRGVQINASYKVEKGLLIADNIDEYILYELLTNEPRLCATSLEVWENKESYKFFCITKEHEQTKKKEKLNLDLQALTAVAKLNRDPDALNKMRFILATNNSSGLMVTTALSLDLEEAMSNIVKMSRERPEDLLAALKDDLIAEKALIAQLVEGQVINHVAGRYFFDGEDLGKQMDMIQFLRNRDNAEVVAGMKAKLTINYAIDIPA